MFSQRQYTLVCNVFQATFLSLFNEKDVWTYGEIKAKTKIEKKLLDSGLVSVCNPKVKLLIKQENKPKFEKDEETVKLNLDFKSQNILIKIIP